MSDEIRGGQLWEQANFPFHRRYVTFLGDGQFALLNVPDEQGSTACREANGKWSYSPEEAQAHLSELGYVNRGSWRGVHTKGEVSGPGTVTVYGEGLVKWAIRARDFWVGRRGPDNVPAEHCLFDSAADAAAWLVEYALKNYDRQAITAASARGYRVIPLRQKERTWSYVEPADAS